MRSRLPMVLAKSLLALAVIASFATPGQAAFPEKPVNLVVMFPPGGGTDVFARAVGSVIEKHLGQPLTVLNKPGGAGLIAGDFIAKAAPDGYTVGALVSTGADPELFRVFRKASYNWNDLIPVLRVAFDPYGLVVKNEAPWKTLQELIDYAKANPNKVSWGHQGLGHSYHLHGAAFQQKFDLKLNDVAYRGAADQVVAILGGKIDTATVSVAASRSHIQAGTMRMLAVQHPARLGYLPQVPTFAEQGADLGFPPHYTAYFVPKGTPPERVKILHDALKKSLEDPQFLEVVTKGGSDVLYGSPDDLMKDVETMRSSYTRVIEGLGLK